MEDLEFSCVRLKAVRRHNLLFESQLGGARKLGWSSMSLTAPSGFSNRLQIGFSSIVDSSRCQPPLVPHQPLVEAGQTSTEQGRDTASTTWYELVELVLGDECLVGQGSDRAHVSYPDIKDGLQSSTKREVSSSTLSAMLMG